MKKYREYMDNVKASDTLHRRLVELEEPGKRPIPWRRYAGLAAAMVLVCGLGGFGAWAAHINILDSPLPFYPNGHQGAPEIADTPQPDIAQEDPGAAIEPGEKTIGGYEVVSGSGETAMVTHYVLPYIEYGDVSSQAAALDWDIPAGATRRNLTQDEIITLMGGEDAVNTHLDWGMYALTAAWAAWNEDGSFWGAYINGQLPNYDGPTSHFEFAVTADQLPPTCIVYPESVTQEVRGLTITADGHDSVAGPEGGVDASTRRVSFMKDGYGYRFDITGTSRALTEERVSRLVARVAGEGLNLSVLSGIEVPDFDPDYDPAYEDGVGEWGAYTCPDCGVTYPAGEEHYHAGLGCRNCGQDIPWGTEHHCESYTCPDCGVTLPEGERHYHTADDAMCSGYPVPVVCPICGETLPAGMEHSHEVCGLPLAPEGTPEPSGSNHHSSHHGSDHH